MNSQMEAKFCRDKERFLQQTRLHKRKVWIHGFSFLFFSIAVTTLVVQVGIFADAAQLGFWTLLTRGFLLLLTVEDPETVLDLIVAMKAINILGCLYIMYMLWFSVVLDIRVYRSKKFLFNYVDRLLEESKGTSAEPSRDRSVGE